MYRALKRFEESRRNGVGGYTLIELLVILLVMTILAGIVVFALDSVTGSASKASCQFDVATVDRSVQAYRGQMTVAPDSISALLSAQTDPDGHTVGPWLHNVPTNGHHYEIIVADGNTPYTGWSTSPASNTPVGTVIIEPWDPQTNNWYSAPDGYVYAPPLVLAGVTANSDGPFTSAKDVCAPFGAS